ncbi:hypothetical protein GPECTOR_39g443 [Gonium pectorale]|uniref:CCAAT-binding factor domain-containing protein n=1 Tax=Gonium pectorale TaxID=33097 RepID=A0A150GAU2_GONPE|nr:hypothetical protein GPECTOR_39g443 [Gonium pectorale]|eukprot:KXZ46949.1 hypothetical protein GPECTOR_39g443 [Gonium pectorale]
MGAREAPSGKKPEKAKKVDADALMNDVKAFASQLGLATGGGSLDDAFSDFAPSKAKQSIAPGAKPNKRQRLNDDAEMPAGPGKQARKQPPAKGGEGHAAQQPAKAKQQHAQKGQSVKPGDKKQAGSGGPKRAGSDGGGMAEEAKSDDALKARDWNFGVGPRPGEAKGFKSLMGKSDSTIWYKAAANLTAATATNATNATPNGKTDVDPDLFELRRAAAEALMEAEAAAFEKELYKRNPSDAKWLQQVKRAGTSTDKLAAATLLVQEGVTSNMRALDQLVALATKRSGGKELVRQAMEALQELFTTVLLPDRKLKFLEQQPLQDLPPGRDGDKQLLLWWTEDCVKRRYAMFVGALEEHSKDNLEFIKEKSMRVMAELLSAKPECEARLLAGLVNKLGDPSRTVASKAVYLLMQLLVAHPVMKPVVVREVERFVFRPGLADKARYYAVVFLNQIPLSHRASEGGDALAKQLIDLYFTLFRMVVEGHIGGAAQLRKQQEERYAEEKKKFWRQQHRAPGGGKDHEGGRRQSRPPSKPKLAVAEEIDARLLSGLITGVRRAFPYVQPADVEPLVDRSASQLFRMVHTAPFTVAVQALMLMYQLMSARAAISDRYYRALYAAMEREGPTTSSRAPMFLSLLFKAMQGDVSVKRVAAFAKRLLQLAAAAQPNWACGALLLLSQVLAAQPALWASITHPEDVGGSGVEEFKDTDDPDDLDGDGVERFRDHDGSDGEEEAEAAGASGRQGPKGNGKGKKGRAGGEEEEEEEAELAGVKLDLDGGRRGSNALASSSGRGAPVQAPPAGSLAARAAAQVAADKVAAKAAAASAWPQPGYYQMDKREPLYANADRSCWWELTALAAHAHPSVSAMARCLLSGAPILFDGDPLRDLSLAAFLDKFVNKKPKPVSRGTSVMQPGAAPLEGMVAAAAGKKAAAKPGSLAQLSSSAFAALAEAEVNSADIFFHKFLNLKGVKAKQAARAGAKAKKKGEEGDEAAAGGDDEYLSDADDEEVDRYLEKQEGMADDALGDPDMAFDYDQLTNAMEEDALGDGSDDGDGAEVDSGDEEGGNQGGEDDEDDDSLEGVNILDMPSPSEGDEAEADGDTAAAAQRRKRQREALAEVGLSQADIEALSSDDDDEDVEMEGASGEEEEDEDGSGDGEAGEGEDEEDDLAALLGGSDDEDAGGDFSLDGSEGLDEEEEAPGLVPLGGGKASKAGAGKKGGSKGSGGKGGGNLFASAEDYEALIERAEREEAEEFMLSWALCKGLLGI